MSNFWKKIGLRDPTLYRKLKWFMCTIVFLLPNLLFYSLCRLGEKSEEIYFNKFMPKVWNFIKK